jgi:succinoglycan biosynthesis protein ExoM
MLRDALESLLHLDTGGEFTYEIVVVDNASTDATKEVVQTAAAEAPIPVRYVYDATPGDASSRNRAIAESQGQWLAFFDDDQLAHPDWLLQLYRAARETGAPVIGGAVRLDLPQDVLDRVAPYVRRTSFRETLPSATIRRFTGKQLPGCGNALLARQVLDTVGNFDATMIWGGSDRDFFLRVRDAGNAMYYAPDAVIRHRIPLNRLTPEYFRWDAQQGCDALACHDYKYSGRLRLVSLCAASIAHGMVVLAPRLAWAWLRGDACGVLENKVRLWRMVGYLRRTLALLAPQWFAQEAYFNYLNFRKGRTIGQDGAPLKTAVLRTKNDHVAIPQAEPDAETAIELNRATS